MTGGKRMKSEQMIEQLKAMPDETQSAPEFRKLLPRKKNPTWNFPPEIRAIWRAAPKLTLCPRFRRVGIDKVLAHIENDSQRCVAVYQQLDRESELICFLMRSRN
jgi:hypothetical protein